MIKILKNLLAPVSMALALLASGCNGIGPDRIPADDNAIHRNQALSGGLLPTLVPTISLPTATFTAAPPASAAAGARSNTPADGLQEPPQPAPLDAACLLGTWEVADLDQMMRSTLAQSGASLVLERVEGRVLYEFSADGGMVIRYDGLAAALSGQIEGQAVRVETRLDGSGTARYTLDPAAGELRLRDFGGEGIQSKLTVNDQVLAEASIPVWLALAGQSGEASPQAFSETRAAAACSSDGMVIQTLEPVRGPALRLNRQQPGAN